MKRLINVRIPLFCALGLIFGIISCHELLCGNFYFGIVVAILLAVAVVVTLILRRNVKAFALLLCFAVIGFSLAELSYQRMEGKEVIEREVQLQGRVCDLGQNGSNSNIYYLENCVDLDSGEKFHGRVRLRYSAYNENGFDVGEVLTVNGTLYSTYPVQKSVNSYEVRNRIYYEIANPSLVSRASGKMKLDEKVRSYVYKNAIKYAPDNGGIIYALLTGDRSAIPDDVKDDFSRAGTIHLLAVSGLHVGFVVTIICFALRKFRLKPLVEGAIVLLPLVFYAYICGFSPSVVRAVIMTACVYLSRVALGRYDLLTSLSISCIIILFSTPYALFDAGFQLSFLSVFGIATLYTPFMRLFSRRKLNRIVRYILNALVVSTSCSLTTLFTLAANFCQVPLLGIFLNLFAIPLVSVVFVLSVIGMIPWVFHYVLVGADKILFALVFCNRAVSSLSFSAASISAVAVSAAIAAVLMLVVGGFVNVKRLIRIITCSVCSLLLVATVLLAMIPRGANNAMFVSYGTSNSPVIAATSKDGEAVLVGDFSNYTATDDAVQFLQRYRITTCTLFVTDYSATNYYAAEDILSSLPVDKVYTLTQAANDSVSEILEQKDIGVIYQYPNSTVGNSVTVRGIFDGALVAVNVNVGELDVCIVTGKGETCALKFWSGADVYVLGYEGAMEYSQAGRATLSRYQTNFAYNYGANKYGNFTIRQKDDRIIFNFS